MRRVAAKQVFEAEKLLAEIQSWSEAEIKALPELYEQKARKYRQLPE